MISVVLLIKNIHFDVVYDFQLSTEKGKHLFNIKEKDFDIFFLTFILLVNIVLILFKRFFLYFLLTINIIYYTFIVKTEISLLNDFC